MENHKNATDYVIAELKRAYHIDGVIGQGASGSVIAGVSRKHRKRVAIKVIEKKNVPEWINIKVPSSCSCRGYRKVTVPAEVAFLKRLQGVKGVIQLVDYHQIDQFCCIVMERPKTGMDLFDYIEFYGALEEDVARHIFGQIIETMCLMSQAGIVHRDIKGENILIDSDTLNIWIIDFGLASFVEEKATSVFRGTLNNKPPEFLMGGRYYPEEGDVWSLGAELLRAMTREEPFGTFEEILNGDTLAPQGVSRNCVRFLGQALCRDPLKRATIEQLAMSPWIQGFDKRFV